MWRVGINYLLGHGVRWGVFIRKTVRRGVSFAKGGLDVLAQTQVFHGSRATTAIPRERASLSPAASCFGAGGATNVVSSGCSKLSCYCHCHDVLQPISCC